MESPLEYAIGIDVGGTTAKFGIVNHRGEISNRGNLPTNKHSDVNKFIDELYDEMQPAINEIGGQELIKGIGVGAPNGNYYNGTIEYAPNLMWRGVIPLAKLISEKFNKPCTLTNDANAAAVGEMMYGAARGMRDFIMITLGTGVGSGIIANGQLILGHDGFAGELGHTIIRPKGRLHPGTGMRGSLETYASATGIALTAKEMLADKPKEKSILRKLSDKKLDSKAVFEAAVKGDKIAKDVFKYTGQILGEALPILLCFHLPKQSYYLAVLLRQESY